MNLPDLYLSPVCLGGRCSLLVMPAPANSTTRFPLLPAVNSVIVVKISLSSSEIAMTGHHPIPLLSQSGGCSPVFVTPDRSNMAWGYVVCVQDSAAVHLLRVTIDTNQLSQSAATGSLSHYQATSLSCLSKMVTSHSDPQHVNIFFSDCSQVVRLSLSTQVFTPLDGATTCNNVTDIKTLPGHPSTLLLTCNTSALVYYNVDSEMVINQTMPTSPKQPSPCSDPLVRMTVVPAAGDVEYGTWAVAGCTHTANVSDAALLSWQCLGDRNNLAFIYTTSTGLLEARLNLIDKCSLIPPPPQTMILSPTDCTNDRCLPLTTIDDQYLVFQFSGATPGLYTYMMYDITPTITEVASINHAASFLMVTALTYELPAPSVSSTLHYTTTTTTTTSTTTASTTTATTTATSMGPSSSPSPSPTPANDNGLLALAVVVPLLIIILAFIVIIMSVMGIKQKCDTELKQKRDADPKRKHDADLHQLPIQEETPHR